MRSTSLIALVMITILALVLRFLGLGQIPDGLQQDETSLGYNAYALLTTGKDEYGVPYPLSFQAFGEYKLPGYIYTSMLPIALFGLNAFSIRFVSALAGTLTVPILYLITRNLIADPKKREGVALLASLALAITPWHLHFSRIAFEVTLSLFFLAGGIALYLIGSSTKRALLCSAASCFFAASLYTYTIARLLAPLLLVLLLWSFRPSTKRGFLTQTLLPFAVFGLLCVPFLFMAGSSAGVSAAQGTLITSSQAVQAPIAEFRGYMLTVMPQLTNLLFHPIILTAYTYITNITRYLSVEFFFLTGSPHGNHGIGTSGMFYLLQLPLILLGIMQMKKRERLLIIALILAPIAIASLTREAPYATRSLYLVLPISILTAIGTMALLQWARTQPRWGQLGIGCVCAGLLAYNMLHTGMSYLLRFPVVYARDFQQQDQPLVEMLTRLGAQRIVIDTRTSIPYTSLLVYGKIDPALFSSTAMRVADTENFQRVQSFGNVTYTIVDWQKTVPDPSTYYVVRHQDIPPGTIKHEAYELFYPSQFISISQGEERSSYKQEIHAYTVIRLLAPSP